MLKAVFFDLYGTLVDIHTDETKPGVWRALAAHFASKGVSYTPARLRERYLAEMRFDAELIRDYAPEILHPEPDLARVLEGLYSGNAENDTAAEWENAAAERWENAAAGRWKDAAAGRGENAAAGHESDPAVCDQELIRETARLLRKEAMCHIRCYAGAKELLLSLRERGRKVYLLSNAQHLFTMDELSYLGLLPLFDDIVLSSDYSVKKPDILFFDILLQKYNLDPDECLMVGNDYICDIKGAAAAGMRGYYILSGISPRRDKEMAKRGETFDAAFVQIGMDLKKVRKTITGIKEW